MQSIFATAGSIIQNVTQTIHNFPLRWRIVLLIVLLTSLVGVALTLYLVIKPPPPPAPEGKTLFWENFEGNVKPWTSNDCVSPKCTIVNGMLRVDEAPIEIRIPNSVLYENFLFEVKVTSLEKSTNWRVALRLFNSREEYYFFIVSRRYDNLSFYQLKKTDSSGDLIELIPATEIYDSRFKKPGDLNSVKLVAKGSKMELYLNDVLLDTFKESYDIDGILAFIVLDGSQVVFDDMRVAGLDFTMSQPSAPKVITMSPTPPRKVTAPPQPSTLEVVITSQPSASEVAVTPIDPDKATGYLKQVFTMWTLSGYLGDHPKALSAFHSLLILSGDDRPVDTMQSWIEEAKEAAVKAIGGAKADYEFLEFDLSIDFESLGLEESYFRLWEHVQRESDPPVKVSNIAAIRLALIASVGEERQQELIGAWNKQIK